jgi:hypothetical protein
LTSFEVTVGIKFAKASSQYLRATVPAAFSAIPTTPFSISMWAFITDFAFYSAWTRLLDAKFDANNWVQICIPQANRIQFGMSSGGTVRTLIPNADLAVSTWYHLVGTWNNATPAIQLFVNAVAQSTVGDQTIVDPGTTGFMWLGTRSDLDAGSTFLDGALDDVRIYNRVLSANEITTITACRGRDNIYYGLQDRWLLNEGYDTQVVSGAGSVKDMVGIYNYTATNSPVYAESVLDFGRRVA